MEVKKEKKTPILVGGTGLYFKALTDGLVKVPHISLKLRNQIRDLQKKLGQKRFYEKLLKLDPSIRGKINPLDTQRSIRAYEVKKFTKKSLTEWFKNTKSNFVEDDFFKVYIDFPRQELIERINVRTKEMIENGAIKEVNDFIKLRVRKDKSANKAIGVNEITEYLKKQKDLNDTRDKIAIKTRQYAKRQSTWARGNMISWMKLKPQDIDNFLKKI
jgi:tRNA dimethylallyltransferase